MNVYVAVSFSSQGQR